jgi:protein-S-isoprenylcysteine O-methyltransferase Ste14
VKIWPRLIRQARKEYSARARLAALACESAVFVFAIPGFLFWLSTVGEDSWRFELPAKLWICFLFLAALGLGLGLWTVWVQFHHARGTPVPIMATKKLLADGPYSLCRNPMAFGTIVCYFSIGIVSESFLAVLAVVAFALFLVVYIKVVEEKEMTMRFGDEYARYRQTTPFIIPRISTLWRRHES